MSLIKPLEFWDLFSEKLPLYKEKDKLKEAYYYGKQWTDNIFAFFDSLCVEIGAIINIPVISTREGLSPELNNNSRIDAIFYKEYIKYGNEIIYLEHENRINTPNELTELDKLANIKSNELKVFIWYYNVYKDIYQGNTNNIERQKNVIINILKRHSTFNDNNWLFILGPATHDNPGGINNFYNRINGHDYNAFTLISDNGLYLTELTKKVTIGKFS